MKYILKKPVQGIDEQVGDIVDLDHGDFVENRIILQMLIDNGYLEEVV